MRVFLVLLFMVWGAGFNAKADTLCYSEPSPVYLRDGATQLDCRAIRPVLAWVSEVARLAGVSEGTLHYLPVEIIEAPEFDQNFGYEFGLGRLLFALPADFTERSAEYLHAIKMTFAHEFAHWLFQRRVRRASITPASREYLEPVYGDSGLRLEHVILYSVTSAHDELLADVLALALARDLAVMPRALVQIHPSADRGLRNLISCRTFAAAIAGQPDFHESDHCRLYAVRASIGQLFRNKVLGGEWTSAEFFRRVSEVVFNAALTYMEEGVAWIQQAETQVQRDERARLFNSLNRRPPIPQRFVDQLIANIRAL